LDEGREELARRAHDQRENGRSNALAQEVFPVKRQQVSCPSCTRAGQDMGILASHDARGSPDLSLRRIGDNLGIKLPEKSVESEECRGGKRCMQVPLRFPQDKPRHQAPGQAAPTDLHGHGGSPGRGGAGGDEDAGVKEDARDGSHLSLRQQAPHPGRGLRIDLVLFEEAL